MIRTAGQGAGAEPGTRLADRRADPRYLGGILLVSVLLRIGVALYLGDVVDAPPLLTDQRSYHALGERLLHGHGYSFDRGWYPFTPRETPTAHWSFLYPLAVAGVYALFGVHPIAVRLVQAVLGGLLIPWLAYRLAGRLFPGERAVPLPAAALAALYPYLALYAATLMTETLFIGLVLWSLELALRMGQRARDAQPIPLREAAFLGLSLGLGVLARQSLLPWLPVLGLWLLYQMRRGHALGTGVRSLAVASAVVVVLIAPWTYRNYLVYDAFLLLNSNTGYAMYSAQHPLHGTRFQEYTAAPVPGDLQGLNEAQMDGELMRRGLQFVRSDPGRYLLLSFSRIRAYLEFWPTAGTPLLHNLGRVGSFILLAPLAAWGLLLVLRRPDLAPGGSLVFLFAAFYSVMHVLTWAMGRYRLPVDAVALPFAALALHNLTASVPAPWAARGRSGAPPVGRARTPEAGTAGAEGRVRGTTDTGRSPSTSQEYDG